MKLGFGEFRDMGGSTGGSASALSGSKVARAVVCSVAVVLALFVQATPAFAQRRPPVIIIVTPPPEVPPVVSND